jgi:hypothetical protein
MRKNKPTMTEARYLKRMQQHEASFDRLWTKIAADTNQYLEDNPNKKIDLHEYYSNLKFKQVENFADSIAKSTGWIYDRLNRLTPANWRMTKKINNALGYYK